MYSVAVGNRTRLDRLFAALKGSLTEYVFLDRVPKIVYRYFRGGNVRHLQLDIVIAIAMLE